MMKLAHIHTEAKYELLLSLRSSRAQTAACDMLHHHETAVKTKSESGFESLDKNHSVCT